MTTTLRTITYGQELIPFEVFFSDRTTLDIAVQPDQVVTVTAPKSADLEDIDQRVAAKARWILKQQAFFAQFSPRTPARRYISGETHLYLGRQYRLKVHRQDHVAVKLFGRYIYIQTPTPEDTDSVKALLNQWYLNRAKDKFQSRLEKCFQRFSRRGFDCPQLRIRKLTKRWGSLTSANTLILNRDLIRAPRTCIDYVITHELCHLKHPNHGQKFYEFLDAMMPDWEQRKQKLEQMLI